MADSDADSQGNTQGLSDVEMSAVAPQLLAALRGRGLDALDAEGTAQLLREALAGARRGSSVGGGSDIGESSKAAGYAPPYDASSGALVRAPLLGYSGDGLGGYYGDAAGMPTSRKPRRPQARTASPSASPSFYPSPSASPATSAFPPTAAMAGPYPNRAQKHLASQVGYLCIADEFDLEKMQSFYDRQRLRTTLEYDVLSVHRPAAEGSMRRDKDAFSLFLFRYGSVVFWGSPVSFKAVVEPDFLLAPRPNSEMAQAMSGRYPIELVATNFPVYCTYEVIHKNAAASASVPSAPPTPSAPSSGGGGGAGMRRRGVGASSSLFNNSGGTDGFGEGDAAAPSAFDDGKEQFERTLKESDHFRLDSRNSGELKLCISHALAQSAKIEYMELKIQALTEKCRPLPRELKDKGSVTIAERALLQLRGEVLYYRLMLKSGSDLLDEPELFWEHEQLKPYFYITRDFFDIGERVRVLDAKLDAANEILGMLSDQFSQRHSSRLEWIVIWLVLVEVIIGVLELMLDLKPWARLLS